MGPVPAKLRIGLRRRCRTSLFVFASLATACGQAPELSERAPAVDDAWALKVPAGVLAQAERGEQTTFWIVLNERADLSPAAAVSDKSEKGALVSETLREHAARSQAGLRTLLAERKAKFHSFWIANTIRVVGDAALLEEVARRPEVSRVEPEPVLPQPRIAPSVEAPTARDASGIEWNIERVGAPRVWSELGVRGEGIVVANIDSGVQFDHPALRDSYRGRYSNGRVDHNYSWFGGLCEVQGRPCDDDGHGTHVMGIQVGRTTDGAHQIGVAPGARWIAAGTNDAESRLAAGEWMIAPTDLRGQNPRPDLAPDVINCSWFKRDDPGVFFKEVLDAWIAAGIFPVFAAGNEGALGCSSHTFPASLPTAYAVGNTTRDDTINESSSRGSGVSGETKPDISAPGTEIRSAGVLSEYTHMTGTSQAAPHVAGAVALLWSAAPALDGDIEATRKLLDRTARDLDQTECGGTVADNSMAGEGLLDVHKAVLAAPRNGLGGLTGRVRRAFATTPVADATLVLSGPRNKWLRSDASGAFRLDRLLPGTYRYRVTAYGYRDATGIVFVRAGAATTLSPALSALPTALVTGIVRAGGAPVADAIVAAADSPIHVRTDATGRYEIRLPLGSRELEVEPPTLCAPTLRLPATVMAGGTTLDVVLTPHVDTSEYGYTCRAASDDFPEGSDKLDLTGATGAVTALTLPFPMPFYGEPRPTAWISTNGVIGLSGPPAPPVGDRIEMIPNGAANASLFPFYSMLDVDEASGVYTTVGAAQVIVEWRNVRIRPLDASEPAGRISFSVVLRPDGTFSYHYRGLSSDYLSRGVNASIGLQDGEGAGGFVYGNYEKLVIREALGLTFARAEPAPLTDGSPLSSARAR